MQALLLRIAARATVRIVLGISVLCLALWLGLLLEMYSTPRSTKPHFWVITPVPGETWPSPLPLPTP